MQLVHVSLARGQPYTLFDAKFRFKIAFTAVARKLLGIRTPKSFPFSARNYRLLITTIFTIGPSGHKPLNS